MLIADAFRIISEANLKIASLGNDYVNQAGTPKQPKTLQQLIRVRQLYNIINRFVFINDAGTAIVGTFGQNDAAVNRLLLQLKRNADISTFPQIPNPIHSFITSSGNGSFLPSSGSEGDILVFQSGIWNNFSKGSDGYTLVSTPTGIAWSSAVGNGIPSGGITGQFLRKNSNTSYDAIWEGVETTDINGVTASAAELNILDGVTGITSTEINYLLGLSSNVQTQLNNKLSGSLLNGNFLVGNSINVATSVTPTGDVTFTNAGIFNISTGVIVNADINASAGILRSKLASGLANRIVVNNVSGAMVEASAITPARVLISDANGIPIHSSITSTTLSYLDATSSVQTQLNGKLSATITSPAQGDLLQYNGSAWINFPIGTSGQVLTSSGSSAVWSSSTANGLPTGGTANQILRKIDATNYNTEWHSFVTADITDISTTNTEINYLSGLTTPASKLNYTNGLTSDAQAQLDLKLSTSLTYNSLFVGNVSNTAGMLSAGSNNQVLMIVSGAPTWQTFTPGTGSVTSIDVSGGTTGLSFSGGPVTTTGTITMAGTANATHGGTGQTSYTVGDILYASSTTALSKLAATTNGYVLTLAAGIPSWVSSPGLTDGDKGDITVSSSGSVWTVDNTAISFAKIQNITTQRLLGRYTASTGSTQEVSLGSGLTLNATTGVLDTVVTSSTLSKQQYFTADGVTSVFTVTVGTVDQLLLVFAGGVEQRLGTDYTVSGQDITISPAPPNGVGVTVSFFENLLIGGGGGFVDPMTTRGDIIVRDASNTTARLGIGANTYVLTSNGTDVAWAAPSGGGSGTVNSGTSGQIAYYASTGTAVSGLTTIPVSNLTSLNGSRTLTSAGNTVQGDNLNIVYANSSSPFNITVDLLSTDTQITIINIGSATVTLVAGSGVTLPGGTIAVTTGNNATIIYRVPATPEVYTGAASGGTVTSVGFTGGIISVSTPTTTPAFTVAGTSGGIPYFSSSSTWASSAVLTANALVVGGGAGVAPSTVTTGTGIITALGINTGSAGAPVLFNGAGGTPTSLVGTNITGTASGFTSGITNALKSATTTVDVSAATAPTSGQVLTATGGSAATWQTPSAGFSNPMTTLGDIMYENATPAAARLAGNTSATKMFLNQTGNGTISAAPAWSALVAGDIPALSYYSLASGGTATSANTFTFNTANFATFTGTWTGTATDDKAHRFTGTLTGSGTTAHRTIGALFDYNMTAGNTGQSIIGVQINPTLNGTFSPNQIPLLVGTTASGVLISSTNVLASGSNLFLGASSSTRLAVGGSGQVELGSSITETLATLTINANAQGANGGKGLFYLKSIIGLAAPNASANFYGINSDGVITSNWSNTDAFYGASFRNSFSPSGSSSTFSVYHAKPTFNASGGTTTFKAFEYDPVKTSMTGITEWSFYATSGNQFYTGKDTFDTTDTAGGTTGAQTINKPCGSVNFAAAATTLVVTNSFATTTSHIFVVVETNDTTAKSATVTRASGSFTITLNAAATAETRVAFLVVN